MIGIATGRRFDGSGARRQVVKVEAFSHKNCPRLARMSVH
jgi:hypothetical protein